MKIKYNSEILAGFIFSLVAAVLFLLIPSEIQTLETTATNAQTIPRIALAGLFIFSFLLLLQGLFLLPKKELVFGEELYASRDFKDSVRSLVYIAIIVVYVFLFKMLGFIASNIYLVFAILLYYGTKKKSYYAIALFVSAIVYLIFTLVLNISMP
ncbi:MAG: tripartite tricarboxylate transporter TctB family protein [Sphaerochaeta sp.]|nr:tripartite tricarboxylate transporter TctB family protein [Sphaerochaeta sp.]